MEFKEKLLTELRLFCDNTIKQNIDKGVVEAANFEIKCEVFWTKTSRKGSLMPPETVENVVFVNPSYMRDDNYSLVLNSLKNIELNSGFVNFENFKIIQ